MYAATRSVADSATREEPSLDRVRSAIVLPLVVFAVAAVIAIGIGMLLHFVEGIVHDMHLGEIGAYVTPLVALLVVVAVTAAGFIASGMGPAAPDETAHHP